MVWQLFAYNKHLLAIYIRPNNELDSEEIFKSLKAERIIFRTKTIQVTSDFDVAKISAA